MKELRLALCGAALALASLAHAQEAVPTCPAPVAASGELTPWNAPGQMRAGANAAQRSSAALAVGQAVRIALLPTPQVRYPVRPEKPGGSVSFGGLVRLDVMDAGVYRVALGSAAWIDLVRDRKALTSIAHGRGPECTGIRKMVDFQLTPGRYILQIAANGEPETGVLVSRLP